MSDHDIKDEVVDSPSNGQTEDTAEHAHQVVVKNTGMSPLGKAVAGAASLLALVILIQLLLGGETVVEEASHETASSSMATPVQTASNASEVAIIGTDADDDMVNVGGIERRGAGRYFFTSIKVPADAKSLYLSGSGATPLEDGSWGDMEQQVTEIFATFKETLEAQGWSMGDIIQVRAFAISDEYGSLDFAGFNRGYSKFFGTEENPLKPVRTFVEVKDLVVPGWLVELEIRAARVN